MRDLFAAFGIWLPRNSAAQAKTGTFVNLEGLSAAEKSRRILRDGIPFKTLLWMKGHIGLYVGSFQGEPVFFHNLWGIRNTLPDGREGRIILGRAVVTSLHPGQERGDVKKQNLLVERLRGMTFTGSRKD
jgi:hypothetical protein